MTIVEGGVDAPEHLGLLATAEIGRGEDGLDAEMAL